ncbi:spore protease YyaC [Wukongibacter baidiensis]
MSIKKNLDPITKAKIHYKDKYAINILSENLSKRLSKDAIIVCIGTDRCIGDALGPLVGTLLTRGQYKYPVYGTLKNPIHAVNLKEEMKKINSKHRNSDIIAVDACLGEEKYIGSIQIRHSPIFPGKGVGKNLPSVGDISIVGIVDKFTFDDFFPIHNIRLSLVMEMAEVIGKSLLRAANYE